MSDERRRFFRIDDIVGLKSQVVEKQELEQRLESFWNDQHQFSLRNEFNFKLEQHQADLQHIKNKMPELGRYLSVLQEQLDLLTDKILADDAAFPTQETNVNISAQGVSFTSNYQVKKDDIVELNLSLLPNQQKIVVFAKVVGCQLKDKASGEFTISLNFEHIHEADREILVKHVHGKQLKSLGAAIFEKNA